MEHVVDKLLEHGIAFVLLVGACIVIWRLLKKLEDAQKEHAAQLEAVQKARATEVEAVQRARIDDGKAHQAQFVDLLKTCVSALTSSTSAIQAEKESLAAFRGTLDKLFEKLEEIRRPMRR